MSVTMTTDPRAVKIEFVTTDRPCVQTQVVVYAHASDEGNLELYYSHEVTRERALPDGSWDKNEVLLRNPLTRTSCEAIRIRAITELIEHLFDGELQVLDVDPGYDPVVFQWGVKKL